MAGTIILCPGQGAQAVGMGKKWCERSAAARAVFDEADRALGNTLGALLSELCFNGPAERLNQTDVSQPAIYVCSIASYRGLIELGVIEQGVVESPLNQSQKNPARDAASGGMSAAAGLSLGEYTALHIAGAFGFVDGLKLVATRGRLMQEAAVASKGGMIALIGADDAQAQLVCEKAAGDGVLVCANFNAPGQIVLSGDKAACDRANQVASEMGFKAAPLVVAGAFHSPLMQPAADQMKAALNQTAFQTPNMPVWSNVTAKPHPPDDLEQMKQSLVQQIVCPVRWSQTCQGLASEGEIGSDSSTAWHELGPGTVLKGLMRRIDRNIKVLNHDEPPPNEP